MDEHLLWALLNYHVPFWNQFLAFYPLLSQCHEISLKVSLMWNFIVGVTSSELSASFSSQPHSSFLSVSLPSLSFWGYSSRVSNRRSVNGPTVVHLVITPAFTSNNVFLKCLCWSLTSLASSLFRLSIFLKVSCGFNTERQGGNTITHFTLYAWTEYQMCTDPSPVDFERNALPGHW